MGKVRLNPLCLTLCPELLIVSNFGPFSLLILIKKATSPKTYRQWLSAFGTD